MLTSVDPMVGLKKSSAPRLLDCMLEVSEGERLWRRWLRMDACTIVFKGSSPSLCYLFSGVLAPIHDLSTIF